MKKLFFLLLALMLLTAASTLAKPIKTKIVPDLQSIRIPFW